MATPSTKKTGNPPSVATGDPTPIAKANVPASGQMFQGGMAQIGRSGLRQDGWGVNEEFLTELRGHLGIRALKEMRENDPIVGAVFFAIEMFLRKVNWFVDPFDDTDASKENAKFLEECKDDMSMTWPDLISEILSFLQYGWSWHEILYKYRRGMEGDGPDFHKSKYDDGKIGWRKFDPRAQDSWERWLFDPEDGGIAGLVQRPAPSYEELTIPIEKSLLFRTQSRKNNPEGRSILRNAYIPYYYKKRIQEIEGVGVERDLAGLPFAQVPAEMLRDDASDDDKKALASIVETVKNVRRDQQEGVIWPQAWDEKGNELYTFKLLNSGGTRQFSTAEIIQRYNQQIAMVVLADFLLIGNDSNGSYAMTLTKTGMFQAALGTWMDGIQDVLNNYAVPRLFALNGIKDNLPKFRHDDIQKPSLADMSVLVSALAGAGAQLFPDADLENWFRAYAQMPTRPIPEDSTPQEQELRDEQMRAQLEQSKAASAVAQDQQKNPGGPPQAPPAVVVSGKNPATKKGSPTKSTGPVKSKLPPNSRRNTKSVAAEQNTKA